MRDKYIEVLKSLRFSILWDKYIKIFLAAAAAILVSLVLGLPNVISTGIVAILTIQPTKRETVKVLMQRVLAFLVALFIAFICFSLIGYTVRAYLVYLAVFLLVCAVFAWYPAMSMDSVLIAHFIGYGSMDVSSVITELLIFFIGSFFGVCVNLSLTKNQELVEEWEAKADAQIQLILERMGQRIIRQDVSDYNGQCFEVLLEQIRMARAVSDRNWMNQFGRSKLWDQKYINMRREQYNILYEMYKNVRTLRTTPETAKVLSVFLQQVSVEYDKANDVQTLLSRLAEIWNEMKTKPLPVDREEFEDRARLFFLMQQLEEFLEIKASFMRSETIKKM